MTSDYGKRGHAAGCRRINPDNTAPQFKLYPPPLAPKGACGVLVIDKEGLVWAAVSLRVNSSTWSAADPRPVPFLCNCEIEEALACPTDRNAHPFISIRGVHTGTHFYRDHSGAPESSYVVTTHSASMGKSGGRVMLAATHETDGRVSMKDAIEAGNAAKTEEQRAEIEAALEKLGAAPMVHFPMLFPMDRLMPLLALEIVGFVRPKDGPVACPVCHVDVAQLSDPTKCKCGTNRIPFTDEDEAYSSRLAELQDSTSRVRFKSAAQDALCDMLEARGIQLDSKIEVTIGEDFIRDTSEFIGDQCAETMVRTNGKAVDDMLDMTLRALEAVTNVVPQRVRMILADAPVGATELDRSIRHGVEILMEEVALAVVGDIRSAMAVSLGASPVSLGRAQEAYDAAIARADKRMKYRKEDDKVNHAVERLDATLDALEERARNKRSSGK